MIIKIIKLLVLLGCLCHFPTIYSQSSFKYVKLDAGTKMAIEDYSKYDNNDMLVLQYLNKQDTNKFLLVGNIGASTFIISPPMYYSLVKSRLILIYNGEEDSYAPSPKCMEVMFDFISNFTDTKEYIYCDWEGKIIYRRPLKSHKIFIYDPLIFDYHVNSDTIISSKAHNGEGGYPRQRIHYEFIMKKK